MKRTVSKPTGFTLVELLVVISIIAILASFTIATIGFASRYAAMNRAKAEISALQLALESYKIENGDYPRDDANTDSLDAKVDQNALIPNSATSTPVATPYTRASLTLYKELSGDADLNRTLSTTERTTINNKVYFSFKPSMLCPSVKLFPSSTVKAIVDPFGNAYGYSTIGSTAGRTATQGYNPTFDLWSTADVDKTGTTPVAKWITNW